MSPDRKRLHAFTLVELLVVIGIIAALIGILLPVLSGVQARGRDIKCQSNVRQIVQAILGYASENKGSMPYGFYFDPSMNDNPVRNANTWAPKGNTDRFVSWASQVGKYMVRRSDGDNEDENFPPVLQCPEAAMSYTHIVGYVSNFVALPSPYYEAPYTPSNIPIWDKPPTTSGMFPHNILIHDTAVGPGLENSVGYLVGADIDNQRLWSPESPQYRFFDQRDPYGYFPPGTLGNNRPVRVDTTNGWRNTDPSRDPPGYPFQGNLRFRHAKGTAVHAGFLDGHVEALSGKFTGDRIRTATSHDVLRKYFLIKWPSGMPRNPSIP
jgi:prepilin-type processing-associated H-X9-DG protein